MGGCIFFLLVLPSFSISTPFPFLLPFSQGYMVQLDLKVIWHDLYPGYSNTSEDMLFSCSLFLSPGIFFLKVMLY